MVFLSPDSQSRNTLWAAGLLGIICTGIVGFIMYQVTPAVDTTEVPTEFHIVVPTYNNARWCIKNIESMLAQTYPRTHWHATIITDACTDNTYDLVQEYVTQHNLQELITVQNNPVNQGALANIYYAVTATAPHEVIVILDGDDWFAHSQVLSDLDAVYRQGNVWLTYGQYRRWPHGIIGICQPYTDAVIRAHAYRQAPYVLSHTKTFYAWLFHRINPQDLQRNGKFFDVCYDIAMMLPMIEMAGARHRCLEKVSYIYNTATGLNDCAIRAAHQHSTTHYIRSLPSYTPLPER